MLTSCLFEMTYYVSSGMLNPTHSLTHRLRGFDLLNSQRIKILRFMPINPFTANSVKTLHFAMLV